MTDTMNSLIEGWLLAAYFVVFILILVGLSDIVLLYQLLELRRWRKYWYWRGKREPEDTMTVLILDQFAGPSPYQLQQKPRRFDELLANVRANPEAYTIGWQRWRGPKIVEVDDVTTFRQPFATIAIIAGPDGMAQVWRERLDSSD